jgi:membrane protease YdiL (CAAX protease family)
VGTEKEYGERRFTSVGLLEVGVALLCYLALSLIAGVVLVALGYDLTSEDPALWLWLIAATAVAPIAGVGLAVLLRSRSFVAVGLRRVSGRWLLIGAGFGLLGWAINRGVVLLYIWITGDTSNPQAGLANTAIDGSAVQFALLVLLAGLIVPFGEEMLFRGVLYT